jgi:hypothetical protein
MAHPILPVQSSQHGPAGFRFKQQTNLRPGRCCRPKRLGFLPDGVVFPHLEEHFLPPIAFFRVARASDSDDSATTETCSFFQNPEKNTSSVDIVFFGNRVV